MSSNRYPEEFKIESVKQVIERCHIVAKVARQLGTTTLSSYAWMKQFGHRSERHQDIRNDQAKIKRLQKELKRVQMSATFK